MQRSRSTTLVFSGVIMALIGAAIVLTIASDDATGPVVAMGAAVCLLGYRVVRSPSHESVRAGLADLTAAQAKVRRQVRKTRATVIPTAIDEQTAPIRERLAEMEGQIRTLGEQQASLQSEHEDLIARHDRGAPTPADAPASIDCRAGVPILRRDVDSAATVRSPADFARDAEVHWIHGPDHEDPAVQKNPFADRTREDILTWLVDQPKWRHHHGVPELKESGDLYEVYVARVDAMLEMCDHALATAGVDDLSALSAVDLASSEGFVATHFLEHGLSSMDCLELSQLGIDRHLALLALSGARSPRIGRIDLELANWAAAANRYDIVFALGIVYHLENPALFARNVYEVTDHVALVESDTPDFPGNDRFRGNGVIYLNRDQVTLESGNVRYLTEMRPDRVALAQLFIAAGFEEIVFVDPLPTFDYFVRGEKSLMICFKTARNRP